MESETFQNRSDPSQARNWLKFNIRPVQLLKRKLPVVEWLPKYTFTLLFQDLLAGFSVALTEVPQAIAYAAVAGLPMEYGLYSGFMGGFVYFIFGSCKDVNLGPTSILSLMVQPHVLKLGPNMAVLMTFSVGCIALLLGLLNLGFLIDFLSYPIIAGFTCAGALQIASSQIKSIFGISGKSDAFLQAMDSLVHHIQETKFPDLGLSIASIVTLSLIKYIGVRFGRLQTNPAWSTRRNVIAISIFILSLARNALVVIIGTTISYCLRHDNPFSLTTDVKAGFPDFKPPPFTANNGADLGDMAQDIGTTFVFMPLVAILEAVSIAKAFTKGRSLDATQEMMTLGIANIFSSFVSSMPITGSFTRTAVNNVSGVKTTLAGVFTSILVLLSIGVLTPCFKYIPKASLAAVIVCAMYSLFDFGAFVLLWRAKKTDLLVLCTTFLCALFISLEYGILIGVSLNLVFVLYGSARPKLGVVKAQIGNSMTHMVTPQDTVHFPAVEYVKDTILGWHDEGLVVLINGKFIRTMDATVARSLVILCEEVELKRQRLVFVNFKTRIMDIFVKIDPNVERYFQEGSLKEILERI